MDENHRKVVTPDQRKKLEIFVDTLRKNVAIEQLIEEINLDSNEISRLLARGDDLAAAVRVSLTEIVRNLSGFEMYKHERVTSHHGYHSGYNPSPTLEENLDELERELTILKDNFPEFADSDYNRRLSERIRRGEVLLPRDAERWALFPRWQLVATSYGEAVARMLTGIKKTRNGAFFNYRAGELDPGHLRRSTRVEEIFEKLAEAQGNYSVLIVPVQLGIHHRGRSVRRVHELFDKNEFGLGIWEVGFKLITHPERLKHNDDLWIDCAGDEFASISGGDYHGAPCFAYSGVTAGIVKLGVYGVSRTDGRFGSATGFYPET